jgi:hypothetical protein
MSLFDVTPYDMIIDHIVQLDKKIQELRAIKCHSGSVYENIKYTYLEELRKQRLKLIKMSKELKDWD